MRVTIGVQASNVLKYLGQASDRILTAQARAVTGKKIVRASDDVPGASRAMTLRSSLAAIEQFQENSKLASSLLNTTDASLASITEALKKVRDIAAAAANSTSGEVRQGCITELDGIVRRLIDTGNTQLADRFIFSGQLTNTKPFVPGTPPATVDYMGDSNLNSVWIQTGTRVEVNVTGDAVFNMGSVAIADSTDTFTMIEQLKSVIMAGDIDATSNMIAEVDKHIANVLSLRGDVGARGQRVEINEEMLSASHERLSDLLSITEDIDLPSAIIDLKTQENVYNAALAVTARITEISLVNHLK